jgi:acetyl-CoA synthetase
MPVFSATPMDELTPAWRPSEEMVRDANLTGLMADGGFRYYEELHRWSVLDPMGFWGAVIDRLGIVFTEPPQAIIEGGARHPTWLPGARMNIVDSCFTAPGERTAVIFRRDGANNEMTYDGLRREVARFANGLADHGIGPGDRIAIAMPMTIESVVAYLGTVAAGAVVVSIADSFAADEIATRLNLTEPVLTVTQDVVHRGGKELPMYEKVVEAGAGACLVVDTGAGVELGDGDTAYEAFLSEDTTLATVQADRSDHTNILFSSGTTGDPKVIPWTHLTPIKAAMDGRYHQDIHSTDVVAWPTNLGWMMGPWLIYASLLNDAAFALYDDLPTGRGFVEFVDEAGVTVLGVVPSMVSAWRSSGALDDAPWSRVRVMSSTGEASAPDDCAWLMNQAGGVPVIEYCGGTEIGGGYITGTVLQDAIPGAFSTPTLGLDVRILDDEGNEAESGELFLVPPSLGMSQALLNRDHDEVYYRGVPDADVPLRRHGDHMARLPNGYYRALGRVDDTMNLGGVKVSSAEIERAVEGVDGVTETAAIAVAPEGGGPSRLVIYAVPAISGEADLQRWQAEMQAAIRSRLNPLFKVDEVVAIDELPRTASAKVMRRVLRESSR